MFIIMVLYLACVIRTHKRQTNQGAYLIMHCLSQTVHFVALSLLMFTKQAYGAPSQQAGQYPSPYQVRHRVHSKHGNRGYKRRANSSAGGDGGSSAFGAGGSGAGLALSSANSHPRGRSERDRFLVDINSGGQRGGAAPSPLLHSRRDVSSAGRCLARLRSLEMSVVNT